MAQVFDEARARPPCAATSPSGTAATPPAAPRCGRTRSRRSAPPPTASLALGHNGNLINTLELAAIAAAARRRRHAAATVPPPTRTCSPRCSPTRAPASVEDSALATLPLVRGAYSLVFMDERTLYAARDPQGFRPLVLGQLARGWVVASETAALDIVGAVVRPRGRAGRADHHRRARACGRGTFARPQPQRLPVRVRLPGPAGHRHRRPQRAGHPGRGRPHARRRAPGRGRPGHPGAGVRHARPRSGTRRPAASPTARAWSRTPTSGGRSSSPARRSGSAASGSS